MRAGTVEAVHGADECLYGHRPLAGGPAAAEGHEPVNDTAR